MIDRIRIVIAEDHAVVREGTRRILEQQPDLEVVGEAADGLEAVEMTERLRPDVVIVDVSMPVVNGIEATRRIKSRHPETSILILSAYDDDQYVFALLEAGAAGYLLKDIRGDELVDAVRSVHAGESILHPAITAKVLSRFVGKPEVKVAPPNLSEREMEVLRLAACGHSNKEIGKQLGLSSRTVQVHLTHIFSKLNVASRTEAVIYGLRSGWLKLDDLG